MLKPIISAAALSLVTMAGTATYAQTWSLDADASKLAFGSIKLDDIGEVHSFKGLTGGVSEEGAVKIGIDLSSVDTQIDIRNERMIAHVFNKVAEASLSGAIDMASLSDMQVGATNVQDIEVTLSFLGEEIALDAELFIARMSMDRVLVTTNDMVFVSVDELGVSNGIDTLQELAGLDSITRAIPVTLRLMFIMDDPKN